MGLDDKGRRRSRSRSSSLSPDRSHKKHKKHKKEKHKKHKKRDDDVDDAKLAAAKAFLEQHLQQAAPGAKQDSKRSSKAAKQPPAEKPAGQLPPGVALLTADDYFARSAEFTAWLQELQHVYFNELTTEESHKCFNAFVAAWNGGELPLRFYSGLAAAPLKRTSHDWGIKKAAAPGGGSKLGMAAFMDDQQAGQQEARAASRAAEAVERRSWRREQKEAMDELLPRATGGTREARVEARLARREEARAREASPELMTVTGGGSIMGGDDSFAAAKAREAKRQEWRGRQQTAKQEALAAKLSSAAQAEADKMAAFRALVAAQGGRISIPKRNP